MVEAPRRSNCPLGSGEPSSPTGLTSSRSGIHGACCDMGLEVSANDPTFEGSATAEPLDVGTTPGPWGSTTVLLLMLTGMSKIDFSLLRRRLGQRMEISKNFSPSIMLDCCLAPKALLTTLLTSAVITPHFWHFSGSTRNSRCDWPRI